MTPTRTTDFGNVGFHVMVHPVKVHINVGENVDLHYSTDRRHRGPGNLCIEIELKQISTAS